VNRFTSAALTGAGAQVSQPEVLQLPQLLSVSLMTFNDISITLLLSDKICSLNLSSLKNALLATLCEVRGGPFLISDCRDTLIFGPARQKASLGRIRTWSASGLRWSAKSKNGKSKKKSPRLAKVLTVATEVDRVFGKTIR
jgi:hypothetical protein